MDLIDLNNDGAFNNHVRKDDQGTLFCATFTHLRDNILYRKTKNKYFQARTNSPLQEKRSHRAKTNQ